MESDKDYSRYAGKYCHIEWKRGQISGAVERIEDGLLLFDFGYGVSIECIEKLEEVTPESLTISS
jgi:hypothetical protein